jgi:hypothetical protein
MGQEIRAYDKLALQIYNAHAYEKDWPDFHHLKRKDRDYWRGLAQIAQEEESWPEPEGDF